MVFLSSLLSFSSLGALIVASLIKGKRMGLILVLVCLGNLLQGAGYIFADDALNGALACFYGALIALVNYFFERKELPVPRLLLALYTILFVVLNFLTTGRLDILALITLVAFFAYVMGVASKNGSAYRMWSILNALIWCIYDTVTASYGVLPVHIILFSFAFVGMMIHDRRKET